MTDIAFNKIPFIDTHCHFDFAEFHNTQAELIKAQQAGVGTIVIPSIGQSNWQKVEELAKQHPPLYYALGLHPYFINQHKEDAIEQLDGRLATASSKCVAIGECGLDFMLDKTLLTSELIDKQYQLFDQQIQLAIKYQLPLILHARKSHDKILQRLRYFKPQKGGVIHAFSGSYQQAMEYIKLGFYIGVGGIITYPRATKTRNAIAQLPLDYLVLETDAPDMPLNGYQGQPNHSAQIVGIFNVLSMLRSESKQQLQQQLKNNSCKLFCIE